jgi:hypothetical protein
MAPPKGIQSVLDKFRTDFTKNTKVLADAAKARDEKIKKKRPVTHTRKKSTTKASSGTTANTLQKQQEQWVSDPKKPNDLPLGLRQKMVIDYLRNKEAATSTEDILNGTGRNIETETDLREALEAHPKVALDNSTHLYSYVPDANIKNKQQLLDFIRKSSPVAVPDLLDSYKKVLQDIEALKSERLLIGLFSYQPELNCEVLYSVDGKYKLNDLRGDAEVTALWTNFMVPDTDDGIDSALRKAGMQPAPRKEKPKKLLSEKKRKKRKQSKLRAVTNQHLLHLLEGEAVQSIDE